MITPEKIVIYPTHKGHIQLDNLFVVFGTPKLPNNAHVWYDNSKHAYTVTQVFHIDLSKIEVPIPRWRFKHE